MAKTDMPVQTVIDQSGSFDLVVIGVSDEWGLSSHLFGWRPERIANQAQSSLLIVRCHAPEAARDFGNWSAGHSSAGSREHGHHAAGIGNPRSSHTKRTAGFIPPIP